jgi:hypothetical protein
MTSFAMIAGMIPMSLGIGEGASQTAPLGRAVIGGLVGATFATLLVLPAIFAMFQRETTPKTVSLHPADQRGVSRLPDDTVAGANGDVAETTSEVGESKW